MHASRPATVRAEPNVTPMIDVMLVLLVIFMVVIPTLTDGFTATSPRAANLRAHPPGSPVLGIDARGRLFLDRAPVSRASLAGRLRSALVDAEGPLYVLADCDLPYGVVRDVLDAAGTGGARSVGLVAERSLAAPR